MPVYFFHLHNHVEARDDEGTFLESAEAARAAAIRSARELIAEDVLVRGEIKLSHWIEVADESGRRVLTVRFGDTIKVRP